MLLAHGADFWRLGNLPDFCQDAEPKISNVSLDVKLAPNLEDNEIIDFNRPATNALAQSSKMFMDVFYDIFCSLS